MKQLEDVLEAYAASDSGPSRAALTEWTTRYPEFARELTAFTARWQLLAWTADVEPAAEAGELAAEDEQLVLRGMSAAQAAFYGALARRQAAGRQDGAPSIQDTARPEPHGGDAPANVPIANLVRDAQQRGLAADALAERVGLSSVLLRKLDRRLIAPASIPLQVLADLAGALGRSLAAVRAYVERPPAFAAGAQHRANQPPALPTTREDFFAAVRQDLSLDDSRRRALLALPRPEAMQPAPDDPHRDGAPDASRQERA